MLNTHKSFQDKWSKNKTLLFSESQDPNSEILKWILDRNGFKSLKDLRNFLSNKTRILDAGCGNGRITALLSQSSPQQSEVVGIDFSSADVAKENLQEYKNVKVLEKNLLTNLSDLGNFDFIYCQEVLHHTGDPQKAFHNLTNILRPKGHIYIYVYKQKAPLREFTDDYIRNKIANLNYEEAFKICESLTLLGKNLSELKTKIKTPKIEILGIPEGEYDVQRFIYHFMMKCFWNSEFSFKDNVVINYDWYHPEDCTRHTVDEVKEWFINNELEVIHTYVDEYGITMGGQKA